MLTLASLPVNLSAILEYALLFIGERQRLIHNKYGVTTQVKNLKAIY